MKVKLDFITNSSSASFILYVTSTENTIDSFTSKWNEYIKYFIIENYYSLLPKVQSYRKFLKESNEMKKEKEEKIKNGSATDIDKIMFNNFYSHLKLDEDLSDFEIIKMMSGEMNIEQISPDGYTVTNNTSMLNDILEDIPKWMVYLILLYNMKDNKLSEFGIKDVVLKIDKDS